MGKNLYITASEAGTGLAAVVESAVAMLGGLGKAAVFTPITATAPKDADAYACTFDQAREMVINGKQDELIETVLAKYKAFEAKYDAVVCAGTDFSSSNAAFELDLNTELAANLGCPLMLVANGQGRNTKEISDSCRLVIKGVEERGVNVVAVVVCNGNTADKDSIAKALLCPECNRPGLVTVLAAGAALDSGMDAKALSACVKDFTAVTVTPKMFEYMLVEQAKQKKMRIVLPEGEEDRLILATEPLLRRGVADITLLGDPARIKQRAKELGVNIDAAEIIDPANSPKSEAYAEAYAEFRKAKGISIEQARDVMKDNTYYGTMMVKQGDADGMVSGAINTTANTIRPAFEFIKTKPGCSIVSSVFLMCLKDRVLVFGDCAVNPTPTPEQVAEIAISSAQTGKVFGIEPRVAMMSYSTGNSGKGEAVDKVKEATAIAKERAPELAIEGPLQYDAAIDPTVARTKMPNSPVAGKATVFIFPDLNTGNNTYKALQRAANAVAIGPILQGLNAPVNDLSRGCTVPDIVNTVVITAIQAQVEKK